MTRVAAGLVAALAVLAAAILSPAHAVIQRPKLNAVASIFAMRPVKAKCYNPIEELSPAGFGAWGYVRVPSGKARYMHLDMDVCDGARRVNDPDIPKWVRAIGVGVLIHEAYHMRRWGASGNEGKVECQAIRHWKVGARMLGATEETVEDLWPYALAEHYELANYADIFAGDRPYRDDGCTVPPLVDDEE